MQNASMLSAKTHLSELVAQARMGEEVILTSGRNKLPWHVWWRSIRRSGVVSVF